MQSQMNEHLKLLASTVNAIGLAGASLLVLRPVLDWQMPPGTDVTRAVLIFLVAHLIAHYILTHID